MTHKEKRKARVKQYLRQLKAMVPPSSGKKGKMGTLSALQHVIGSLQKIQGMQLIEGAGVSIVNITCIIIYAQNHGSLSYYESNIVKSGILRQYDFQVLWKFKHFIYVN